MSQSEEHSLSEQTRFAHSNFEIYLTGSPNFCCSGKPTDKPIKFTKENIPIPLYSSEYVKFISSGCDHLIMGTNFSKCYLFGDYNTANSLHFCEIIPFQITNTLQNHLNCNITHLECGEQFVIVKDELDRFWYVGKSSFGLYDSTYRNFVKLNNVLIKQELISLKGKITQVVAGARHIAICINDLFIYCIGNNYANQLGYGKTSKKIVKKENFRLISSYSFVKVDWNLNSEFKVKQLGCTGNETVVLTKCGKLFITSGKESDSICSFKEYSFYDKISVFGTNWGDLFFVTESGASFLLSKMWKLKTLDTPLFSTKNLQKLKLSTGLGHDEVIGYFNEERVKIYTGEMAEIVLKPELPIVKVNISATVTIIYCFKEHNDLQCKLFKTKGLFDILLHFY